MNNDTDIQGLITKIRAFATDRDWEKFHTPKNLAMAIAGEAGELVAEFQWLTSEESLLGELSPEKLRDIRLEMADVQIYLLRLADVLQIDISEAVLEKMKINESRFK
jgi:NTP pyrophosphatase (non-canonical NTP hydrolase)